ncbi:MAG: hypothetical protein R3190_09075 [Thermoanaerobaculia bacterium]|nr:hypothetical protein [Thermoanaerobaculia bacterium]
MEVDYQPKEGGIELRFEDREGVERFFDEAAETEAFFLDLPGEPRQYQVFRCSVQHGERFRFSFEAEVVQVFPRGDVTGVAFHLKSWNAAKTKELQRLLAAADSDEELGPEVSPIFKIKKMNPNQRFRLAMKASRVERGILLRDTSPEVLAGLLSHPRIEEKEVLEIVKSPYASGGILKRVGDNRKWMHNADIRLAVVKSPKTPTPLAIKHLPTLRTSELRTLAKMGNAREALRKEALKVYLARMGQGSGGF